VHSGEVLALISLPDFDPNKSSTATPETTFNRATLGTYEMGSTFKIFTTAMALDAHTATLAGGYDASHPITIGRFTIHDYHDMHRWLSVPEIFEYSSNIGAARMAMDAGGDRFKEFLGRVGLLRAPTFEIPEIGAPLVPSPWRDVSTMTVAFGHGISVSPLQLAIAASAVVNGGVLHQATIVKPPEGYVPSGQQVMSPRTSEDMRRLMRLVVEQGTGKDAAAPGYLVGGKTGTAEKAAAGGYRKKSLLSTFIAVFPMTSPRYVVQVMIDEPHGTKDTYGFATAAWVAAPATRRIIERMGPLLGVPTINENSDEVRRAMAIDVPRGAARIATR